MSNTPHNKKDKTIVLTGSTGNLGRFLTLELLQCDGIELILLVRAESPQKARARVQEIIDLGGNRVKVFCSDLTVERLGLSESDYADLARRTTHILHSAASVRFTHPLEEARLFNVKTTDQMVSFARACLNLVRFGYISTALVAGNRSGVISEDDFEHNAGFKNTYEQTKYEAEYLVRTSFKELPVVIFRPPLILPPLLEIDKSPSSQPNALYLGISLAIRGNLTFLPGTENSVVDVVDSNMAAVRIVQLMTKPSLAYKVYHITNNEYAPSIKAICDMIEKKIKCLISLEFCGSMDVYSEKVRSIPWYKFKMRKVHKKISSFIAELAYPKIYKNIHTLEELHIPHLGQSPIDILEGAIDEDIWKFSA